jgi:rhodanese-related sulfurtransferase
MPQPGAPERVTVAQAATELTAPARREAPEPPLLVDVRERHEVVAQRVPGSVWMPMSSFVARFPELPRDRRLLIICAHGNRSLVVADFLGRQGYRDVASVDGGTLAWSLAGHPTVAGLPDPDEGLRPA